MEEIEGILELNKTEGIYIDIGTKVYLEIEGVNFSVTSIFIGMLKDEFMIVTLPKRYKSVKNKLFPGNRMVVKYLHDGSVYAFQSSVIELITNPIRALAIEYPKIVQERELRIIKRNNVIIPGRVEAKKTEFPVLVNDISKNGCSFIYQNNKSNIASLKANRYTPPKTNHIRKKLSIRPMIRTPAKSAKPVTILSLLFSNILIKVPAYYIKSRLYPITL